MPSSFHPPRFWSGVARNGGGTACVSGGTHVAITRGVIVRVPWRAGAEQEGEEEGHITLRVVHQAAVMVMDGSIHPEVGMKLGLVLGFDGLTST